MDFEKVNRIAKVHHYKKKGFSNAKISRMLGIHRNTVISDLTTASEMYQPCQVLYHPLP